MAVFTIQGGAKLETATPDEVRSIVQSENITERERYRAIKPLRRSMVCTGTAAGTRITINDGITPEAGYSWVVRQFGVYLASAGTGQAFITSDTTSTLGLVTQSKIVGTFGTSQTGQVQFCGNGAVILDENEGLYLNFTQNIIGYIITGWNTPAELVGRFS